MKIIDIFYQGEGLGEIGHFAIEADATFAVVKAKLSEKHDIAVDVLLFAEDKDSPLDDKERVGDHASASGLKLHFSSCHRIKCTSLSTVRLLITSSPQAQRSPASNGGPRNACSR